MLFSATSNDKEDLHELRESTLIQDNTEESEDYNFIKDNTKMEYSETTNCKLEDLSITNVAEQNVYSIDLSVLNAYRSYESVSPSKRFVYWAFRRLYELPREWQPYYRSLLRQEILSKEYVGESFECFVFLIEGYRKVKWVLNKFDINIDESLIPTPYNNFWDNSTYEERAWIFHYSNALKSQQGEQRIFNKYLEYDDYSLEYDMINWSNNFVSKSKYFSDSNSSKDNIEFSEDLPIPVDIMREDNASFDDKMDNVYSQVENGKLHNPLYNYQLNRDDCETANNLYDFEDEDEL